MLYACGGGSSDSKTGYLVFVPPPEAQREIPPLKKPNHHVFWVEGYWKWTSKGWAWQKGYWEKIRPKFRYVPVRWVHSGRGWIMLGGEFVPEATVR